MASAWLTAHGATGTHVAATNTSSTPSPAIVKSIRQWAVCDGQTDDSAAAGQAFAAAAHGAFTLLVDCPVRLNISSDIAKPIFIDDDTTVEFGSSGSFIVNNVLQPAFVIAGSQNITLSSWNVQYVGGLPVNPDVGGYVQNGVTIKVAGYAQTAMAFNNLRLTSWLTAHRNMTFQSGVTSEWAGPTNTSAVFFLVGDVSNLQVDNMKLSVPATAGGNHFIPMAFSLTRNFKSSQTVSSTTPATAAYRAVPHDLLFSNIELDGTYMGWQGTAQNATFTNIQSHRYGDLQDVNGQTVGGVDKWFAPPHLFYLNYVTTGDPLLFNRNISISNVVDDGPRIGVARDRGGSDTVSGYASSLKLSCVGCQVNGYQTSRPDGFLDLCESHGLTIENASGTYDSAFLNNIYPGWRFPSSAGSSNVTVQNVTLVDTASSTIYRPVGYASQTDNQAIVLKNVAVTVNQWAGSGSIAPWFAGTTNDITAQYTLQSTNSRFVYASKNGVSLTLRAQPAAISSSQSALLTWVSQPASSCSASGGWSGVVGGSGSLVYKPLLSGSVSFSLSCQSGGTTAAATLALNVL